MKAWLLILVLFLVGCSASQVIVQPEKPDAAPTANVVTSNAVALPAPAKNTPAQNTPGVQGINNAAAAIFGDVNKSPDALKIDNVVCDKEKKAITFSFRNNDDQGRKWQLNNDVRWGDLTTIGVHVLVNSYEVNSRDPYIVDGVRYFGPNEKFSDNCGGVEALNPGQTATCTVYPVPLKEPNVINKGINEIFVKTYTSNHIIQFLCN